jgi:riboflavin kinase/FMN adenylyltransferase
VTLGNFDGMHLGHQHLIREVVSRARARQAKAAVVTFYPHPLSVHRPGEGIVQLQSLQDRLDALEALGVDATLVVAYTLDFAGLNPPQFAQRYLVDGLHAVEVVVGQDIRFGQGNSGDLGTMRALGEELGFTVTALDDQGDPEDQALARWSSSGVRSALADGDVGQAARILGRPHTVNGQVVSGDKRGRKMGFPTANLGGRVTGLIPADGVYAGYLVRLDLPDGAPDRRLPAAISVGTNPTFDGAERRVEAHAIGRSDLDLYGENVTVQFVERLRHTLAFTTTEALVTQMRDDVQAAARVLRSRG